MRMSKRLELRCAECGTTFQRYPSQMKPGEQYCSRECNGAAKRHGSTLHCAMCDTPFYRRYGEQDVGERVRQFCSRPCYTDWRILHRKASTYPKQGAVHVHRIVAEAVLGRPLLPDEVVHHKDLNRHHNDPGNLAVFPSQADHARCHAGGMSDDELRGFSLT
jgi:hypothetical protein